MKQRLMSVVLWFFLGAAAAVHTAAILNLAGTEREMLLVVTLAALLFVCGVRGGYSLATEREYYEELPQAAEQRPTGQPVRDPNYKPHAQRRRVRAYPSQAKVVRNNYH